ncbi:Acyl-CoA dehydrogenase [Mesobacillus persicus]|uniref:Acyl-CoA dehydrogenase n=1 Tax=Mesobacillus persicus TaxID=930146 RepID=A0A1H8DCJ3_9BACI|nr:acyl-CoA dehydrogenase family protein [Mesobacillus persicus]SEN04514.1 Acyl-CoA dehydrogenase [Mesobacillus persicus]
MRFDLTDEQRQLKEEIRSYLDEHITAELLEELIENPDGGPLWRQYIQNLGKDGWLGIGWPVEYGGQGKTPLEQYIFLEEIERTGVNIPFITLETVGPTLMKLGTEEQKNYFLPKILKGEVEIAIGYSEPQAGTDLAALETRAVREGDSYVINGQKVFTTNAHMADYIWLAARTDADAPKHKGISIFLVPTKTPGFSVTPMDLIGERSNVSYYEDVRIPLSALVGEENKGWQYITTQLSLERLMLSTYARMERMIEETIEWASENEVDGVRVLDQHWVRDSLAELTMEMEVLKLLNYRAAWAHNNEKTAPFRPSMNKVFAAELNQKVFDTCMQIMGMFGQVAAGSEWTIANGSAQTYAQKRLVHLFGGGANDIQRDLVARFGLGLPKS